MAREDGVKANEYTMDLGYWTEAASYDEGIYYKYQADQGIMNQRLALYVNGTKADFTQASATITEVYGGGIGGSEKEYQPEQFSISAEGVLTSKEALSYGTYDFSINISFGGVEEELFLSYTVGIAGECSFPVYEVSYNGHTRYGINTVITYNLNSGSTVGELVNAYYSNFNKKIAGYDIVGWKNANSGAVLAGNTPITSIMEEDGYVNICPVFQRKADGHIYQVVLQ